MSRRGRERYAPEATREEILEAFDRRVAALIEEEHRKALKPPATPPDSPAANIGGIGVWAILATIGAASIIYDAIAERPTALLPLALFLGLAAFGGWVLFRETILGSGGRRLSFDKSWVRWTVCVGLFIATVLAIGGLLRVLALAFRQ